MIKTRIEVSNIDKHANLPHYVVNYGMNYSCKKVLQKVSEFFAVSENWIL